MKAQTNGMEQTALVDMPMGAEAANTDQPAQDETVEEETFQDVRAPCRFFNGCPKTV